MKWVWWAITCRHYHAPQLSQMPRKHHVLNWRTSQHQVHLILSWMAHCELEESEMSELLWHLISFGLRSCCTPVARILTVDFHCLAFGCSGPLWVPAISTRASTCAQLKHENSKFLVPRILVAHVWSEYTSWWCTFCCWPHLKQVWPTLKACLGFVSVSALKQTWKTIIRCACPFNLIVLEYHFLEKIFWEESFGKPFYWKTVLLEKTCSGKPMSEIVFGKIFWKIVAWSSEVMIDSCSLIFLNARTSHLIIQL